MKPPKIVFEEQFWSNSAAGNQEALGFNTTEGTDVVVWDSRNEPTRKSVSSGSEAVLRRLDEMDHAMGDTVQPGVEPQPFCIIFSAVGSPSPDVEDPLRLSREVFSRLNGVLGFRPEFYPFYFTRYPHYSYYFDYDGSCVEAVSPTALVVLLRCPRNSSSLACVLRIRLADRAAVAFLFGRDHGDVNRVTDLCASQHELLKLHPLYLLAFIYETRFESWMRWLSTLWVQVNEIETATRMTSESWRSRNMSAGRLRALQNTDTLLTYLHSTHTELCHSGSVLSLANKMGTFCLVVLDELEKARLDQMLPHLPRKPRSGLDERLRFTATRCEAVRDRLLEMKERLNGQIQVSFSLVAQQDSKLTIQDSGTMKAIAVLGLAFLPASLITAIWSADLFQLNQQTNWKAYLGTTLGLTAVVFLLWALYMRFSKPSRVLISSAV